MTLVDLKKALLELMAFKFPAEQYKYYSQMVVEGYKRPSFFTQLKPVSMEPVNYNSRKNHVTFYIDYMQKNVDEADALEVITQIRDLFGLHVKVGDRCVDVTGFDYEFVGSERVIPEITIDLEWHDRIEHTTDAPVMESADFTLEMEE